MSNSNENSKLREDSPLRDVVACFGTKKALADELGVTKQWVSGMNMDAPLSRLHYLALRYEKRPDLYVGDSGKSA